MIHILLVSDTHLSPRAPEADHNWAAVVRHAEASAPDLVLHAGDLTLDEELEFARPRLDGLGLRWLAVPGNHDIGDNPGVSAAPEISDERLARWRRAIGADWWSTTVGRWHVVGVNAQLFGSGLTAEQAQDEWLADALATDAPTVLVTHKPLAAGADELATSPAHRFVPAPARARLTALLCDRRVPLVVSGHVHQFRLLGDGMRTHAWAPSAWAVLPDRLQPTIGLKRCGVLSLRLDDGGTASVEHTEPAALRQHTLGVDVPDPYEH